MGEQELQNVCQSDRRLYVAELLEVVRVVCVFRRAHVGSDTLQQAGDDASMA